MAMDVEFMVSDVSAFFVQQIATVNLPSGGPAYPLSTPGVRLKLDPTKDVSLLLAALNGDPAGPGLGDEQLRNRNGLNFRVHDRALVFGELQFRHSRHELEGTLKLGGWFHLGDFDDQRFAGDGSLLADPDGLGVAARRRRNSAIYGVLDQQIWRPQGGSPGSGVSIYARGLVSPSDRNSISLSADGGIVFAGLIPHRPDDRFGASVMYLRFSDNLRAFDRDVVMFTGAPGPIRDYEANLEVSYMAQIVPGWTVQPTLQFIWHPSGDAGRNATVAGARSIWRY